MREHLFSAYLVFFLKLYIVHKCCPKCQALFDESLVFAKYYMSDYGIFIRGIPPNQIGTTAKDRSMRRENALGKIQPSERYYELAFVFRRDDHSGVLIGAGGERRSDWPAHVLANDKSTRIDR